MFLQHLLQFNCEGIRMLKAQRSVKKKGNQCDRLTQKSLPSDGRLANNTGAAFPHKTVTR